MEGFYMKVSSLNDELKKNDEEIKTLLIQCSIKESKYQLILEKKLMKS